MNNIEFLLQDDRNCRSDNMKKFFSNKRNQHNSEVIRFEGQLWFVSLGWRIGIKKDGTADDTGFAGVRVVEVACQGNKATTCYPSRQRGGDYEIVTDWFWDKYRERGIISIPEVWHRVIPAELTHKEHHQF